MRFHDFRKSLFPDSPHQIPREKINWEITHAHGVEIFVQRDDLIHPFVSGNKLRKLYLLLSKERQSLEEKGWSSCGGVWSNHLLAMAFIATQWNIPSTFYVRADTDSIGHIPYFKKIGIKIVLVNRTDFKAFHQADYYPENINNTWIPEGGSGESGIKSILHSYAEESFSEFSEVYIGSGTGTSLLGLHLAKGDETHIKGVSTLKVQPDIWKSMLTTLSKSLSNPPENTRNLSLPTIEDHLQRRFAAIRVQDIEWIQRFYAETGLLPDPVYTWRIFWTLEQKLRNGLFSRGEKILVIHTGGLHAWMGYEELWNQHSEHALPTFTYPLNKP